MANKNKIVIKNYKHLDSGWTNTLLNIVVSNETWKEIKEKTNLNILEPNYFYFVGINDLYSMGNDYLSDDDIYEFKSAISPIIKKDNNDVEEIEYSSDIILPNEFEDDRYISFYLVVNAKDTLETLIKEEFQSEFEVIEMDDAAAIVANMK